MRASLALVESVSEGEREFVVSPVDWIDPEALKSFEFYSVSDGDREVLFGYLDFSRFPKVEEFQRSLKKGE